jgi:hypothetical protein
MTGRYPWMLLCEVHSRTRSAPTPIDSLQEHLPVVTILDQSVNIPVVIPAKVGQILRRQ